MAPVDRLLLIALGAAGKYALDYVGEKVMGHIVEKGIRFGRHEWQIHHQPEAQPTEKQDGLTFLSRYMHPPSGEPCAAC